MVSRCAARLLFRARLHAVYPGDAATRRIARTVPGDPLLAHRPASCRARLRQARSRRAAAPELLVPRAAALCYCHGELLGLDSFLTFPSYDS